MPDLIAQGKRHHYRWRRQLTPGKQFFIGRSDVEWSVPWDSKISRSHVSVLWNGKRLEVATKEGVTNPVFYDGSPSTKFLVQPGEHFVIGDTSFSLVMVEPDISQQVPRPVTEQTFSHEYLRDANFQNAERQIEALSRLPDLITRAADDLELIVQVVSVLLAGIENADAIALARVERKNVNVLHWDQKHTQDQMFRPSERLIRETVKAQKSIVHAWSHSHQETTNYTQAAGFFWAFAVPIRSNACPGWVLYVAGGSHMGSHELKTTTPEDLRDDLKFTEIVSTTIGNVRELRMLEKQKSAMSHFFSAQVLEAIDQGNADQVLAPRETKISVMFCDLRGFSKQSEDWSGNLIDLMHQVSNKLGIVTHYILKERGVIGDFHGDSAMGFWGWPINEKETVRFAVQAASSIRDEFSLYQDASPDSQIGIGIATGTAVAGRIGTIDQQKVTAFGPVVNLASRLENLNRVFGTDVLVDRATAKFVKKTPSLGVLVRRVARIRPYGMRESMDVFQLTADSASFEKQNSIYENALDAFLAGEWILAAETLSKMDVPDGPKEFLLSYLGERSKPPTGWLGVIDFLEKNSMR